MLLASLHGFAQQEAGKMTWIPKLGVNLSTLGDDDVRYKGFGEVMTPKYTIGVVAGMEGEYHMSKMLSLSAGALYSMQGAKYDDIALQKDYSVALHYVNVPVLLNLYIVKGLALKAGIQAGYAFYKKESYKENLFNGGWKDYSSSGAGFSNFDFSVPVGLSYDFDKIRVDLRYNYGLLDLSNRESQDPVHNRVFQFSVGYCLGK